MKRASFRRSGGISLAVLAAVGLGGCSDSTPAAPPPVVVAPTPPPTPTPPATGFNVAGCLNQMIPGTGTTVAQAVLPDTTTLTLSAPSGFPNGRGLTDPVIDVTLAVLFLDLTKHSPATLAGVPVNPPANDRPFRSTFPYLAVPQGTPPLADTSGTSFNFRSDELDRYVRVDRTGMPAVATALISSASRVAYNAGDPIDDMNGIFVPEITRQLTGLTNALVDDLVGLGLTPCAKPN